MISSSDIPDRPGEPLATYGRTAAEFADLIKRIFCTHPGRVDISTIADKHQTLHCPACGEQWTEAR
ncbi:hypothetical protein ACIBJE_02150 [Micromonospora sp. NPDC050187]|uniref:hypothetical protein n=1 Tax=Micromonospora sp. NPDC050187 TaxID=3364277 RepID=UPI00378C21FF